MSEIEPTVENVKHGDIVLIETGTPGEQGSKSETVRVWAGTEPPRYAQTIGALHDRVIARGWTIARITRPSSPVPDEPGTRFWAVPRYGVWSPREFIVTDEQAVVSLASGVQWDREDFPYTVTPPPKPETVPVPADLAQEVEDWWCSSAGGDDLQAAVILARVARAVVEERDGEADDR